MVHTYDASEWRAKTPGIPDEFFKRTEGVPITKEEVRAVQISKARLRPGLGVLDVGCGSGSVTVEAAIQVGPEGRVVAIDRDEAAVALTEANLQRFGLKNIAVRHGDALSEIGRLESAVDAVIIGGTGGDTAEIVRLCAGIINPGGRIVIGVIQIETLYAVLQVVKDAPFADTDVTQVTISKSRKTSTGTMMLARNPVTIISASRTRA